MKNIILFLLLASSVTVSAQVAPVYIGGNAKQITGVKGGFQVDSVLLLPFLKSSGDTTLLGIDNLGRTYRITKTMIGKWIGSGGGSQTIDQTLGFGNTTNKGLIFTPNGRDALGVTIRDFGVDVAALKSSDGVGYLLFNAGTLESTYGPGYMTLYNSNGNKFTTVRLRETGKTDSVAYLSDVRAAGGSGGSRTFQQQNTFEGGHKEVSNNSDYYVGRKGAFNDTAYVQMNNDGGGSSLLMGAGMPNFQQSSISAKFGAILERQQYNNDYAEQGVNYNVISHTLATGSTTVNYLNLTRDGLYTGLTPSTSKLLDSALYRQPDGKIVMGKLPVSSGGGGGGAIPTIDSVLVASGNIGFQPYYFYGDDAGLTGFGVLNGHSGSSGYHDLLVSNPATAPNYTNGKAARLTMVSGGLTLSQSDSGGNSLVALNSFGRLKLLSTDGIKLYGYAGNKGNSIFDTMHSITFKTNNITTDKVIEWADKSGTPALTSDLSLQKVTATDNLTTLDIKTTRRFSFMDSVSTGTRRAFFGAGSDNRPVVDMTYTQGSNTYRSMVTSFGFSTYKQSDNTINQANFGTTQAYISNGDATATIDPNIGFLHEKILTPDESQKVFLAGTSLSFYRKKVGSDYSVGARIFPPDNISINNLADLKMADTGGTIATREWTLGKIPGATNLGGYLKKNFDTGQSINGYGNNFFLQDIAWLGTSNVNSVSFSGNSTGFFNVSGYSTANMSANSMTLGGGSGTTSIGMNSPNYIGITGRTEFYNNAKMSGGLKVNPIAAASGDSLLAYRTSDSSVVKVPYPSAGSSISGTPFVVPKFNSGGNGLQSSSMYDNGTFVGVKTTTPSAELDVNGVVLSSKTSFSLPNDVDAGAAGLRFSFNASPINLYGFGLGNLDGTGRAPMWYSTGQLNGGDHIFYNAGNERYRIGLSGSSTIGMIKSISTDLQPTTNFDYNLKLVGTSGAPSISFYSSNTTPVYQIGTAGDKLYFTRTYSESPGTFTYPMVIGTDITKINSPLQTSNSVTVDSQLTVGKGIAITDTRGSSIPEGSAHLTMNYPIGSGIVIDKPYTFNTNGVPSFGLDIKMRGNEPQNGVRVDVYSPNGAQPFEGSVGGIYGDMSVYKGTATNSDLNGGGTTSVFRGSMSVGNANVGAPVSGVYIDDNVASVSPNATSIGFRYKALAAGPNTLGIATEGETRNYLSNKLGIGVAAPQAMLDVLGNIKTSGTIYYQNVTPPSAPVDGCTTYAYDNHLWIICTGETVPTQLH